MKRASLPLLKSLIKWLGPTLAIAFCALSPALAFASPCDDFYVLKLDPDELQKCIHEIKFTQELRAMEINALKTQLCILAIQLALANPTTDNHENAKDFCPMRPKLKTSPKNKPPIN
jgi:hypothetical protein